MMGTMIANGDDSEIERLNPPMRGGMVTLSHRILIYTTCYNVLDGVTLTIRKIEKEILAAGHHVCILTTKSADLANTHLDGEHPNRQVLFLDNSVPIPFLTDPNNPNLSYHLGFSLSPTTKDAIAEFEPSLIHVTAPDCTCLHLIQYARDKEIPLMGTYHSNIPEYMNHYPGLSWLKHILAAFFRHQYNFLQALYVPTPFIQKFLVDTYKMDRITDLKVWGRGIDLEKFSPSKRSLKFRQKLGIADDEVVVTWVGRIVPEKRPDIFSRVIRQLCARRIPFRALVVGAGPGLPELKTLPKTTCLGWLSGEELAVAYASSDVFLFPSAVETFGNVTLEAAASGLPLVVEGGCSGHLVKHGVNGFACFGDDQWFESTLRLVVDAGLRASCSRASREHSLNYEQRAVVRRMLDNYSHVTDEFFTGFGGRHENRDLAYAHEYSYVAGNHPRPYAMVVAEYVVILLFRVASILAAAYFWFQATRVQSPVAVVSGADQKDGALASLGKHSQCDPPDKDDPDEESMVDYSEEIELIPVDASTEASTDASVSSSPKQSLTTASDGCCGGECRTAHILAKSFVATVQFQCRIESKCRNAVNVCIHPSKWSGMTRERKDSSVFDKPRLRRGESESSINVRVEEELGRRVRNSVLDA